jgi:hypothetical protein
MNALQGMQYAGVNDGAPWYDATMMDYATVKIVLDEIATSPEDGDIAELTEAIRWVRDRRTIHANDKGPGPVHEIHSEEFESAVPEMEEIRRLLRLRHFDRAAVIAKRVRALLVP